MSILPFRRKDTEPSSANMILSSTANIIDDNVYDLRGPLGLNLLYSPSEPLIDFVFVHGLGGGSKKTWSKTSSVTHYWPQAWLPKDPAFKDVRVHSFGYDSDWAKGKENCLNIHHFGKSLLGEMYISPCLRDSHTAIVLIGHSMGGLVIKKAHILARQDAGYQRLVERFHTIFFLATPHRGSDSAKLLNTLLQITNSSRAYVADLERGSNAIQSINDEFRNYSNDINLWSFYETQKLKMGFVSTLIVDPDSATLGYRAEKQMPMNANHRSICKFETPKDPNYITLRNALATIVQSISKLGQKTKEELRHRQIKDLKKYLDVPESLEDDLVNMEDARLSGTCEWFSEKESYQKWSDVASEAPRVLWVSGRPAAGKSVLAGYAIDQLGKTEAGRSYFFFKYGDKSKSQLSSCLRSLAFQMACTSNSVLEKLREMQRDGIKVDNDNERTIWRKVFLSGIFQTRFPTHYWVIDALDECLNITPLFDPMLGGLNESIPLRILITSRETPELKKQLLGLGAHQVQHERISIADTLPDLKLLAELKTKSVSLESAEVRAALVERILGKSEGSFLWTNLILGDLSNSHGEEEIDRALEEMPQHMEPLYSRILETMTQATRGKKLAQAVLTWITCAIRPLTTQELVVALKVDVDDHFPNLKESILAVCGHLVIVDKFDRVQMVHGTARDFLLDESLESEFAIKKTEAHTRIARACLTYLTEEEMKPPRTSRPGSTANIATKRAGFSTYACTAFSYHLAKADPLANDVLMLTNKFLKSNVLSWIEVIAQTQNLVLLIRAAKNLRKYFNSCAAARSPLGAVMQTIRGWTTDFIRIAAKFADALMLSPSAIYSIILPFCPLDSAIRNVANPRRGLSVLGLSNDQWDDRLSCIDFRESPASAISYGDEFFAVGLINGRITTYHVTSCQEFKVMNQGEPVKILQFKSRTGLMASCGMKTIHIWDVYSGEVTHRLHVAQRIINLVFDRSLLIAALSKNYFATWDLNNNCFRQPDRLWSEVAGETNPQQGRMPSAVSISIGHRMLAAAYSGRPIMLWDMNEDLYYGECGKKLANGETSTHMVTALVFNPNPNIELLVTSYLDGDLVLLNPFNDQQVESFRANCHTLAASSDGRLLAGGGGGGTIQVYEFDTLRLLYRVKSSDFFIKQLAFSIDNLRLSDIRGSHCNIWEPALLLRDSIRGDSSEGTSTSVVDAITSETKVKISTDELETEKVIFQSRLNCGDSIIQVLPGEAAGKFILSTRQSDHLWNIDGLQEDTRAYSGKLETRKWIQHHQSMLHMICIQGATAHVYAWKDWSKVMSVNLAVNFMGLQVKSVTQIVSSHQPRILLEMSELDGSPETRALHLLKAVPISVESFPTTEAVSEAAIVEKDDDKLPIPEDNTTEEAVSTPLLALQLATLAPSIAHVIGCQSASQLVYLDIKSWVCSVDLKDLSNGFSAYSRHFFVPYDWFAGIRDIIGAVTQQDVIFARNDNIAIVKSGLTYAEVVSMEMENAPGRSK